MPALPSVKEIKLDHLPNALSAYNVCLAFEKEANTEQSRLHARILGYLIIHAPSSTALAEIVKVIHSCAQDHKTLSGLGESFLIWFIRPFKKNKGRTPTPSDHPSRPSFDKVKADLKAMIKGAPKDHKEAKKQALVRDGCRCVVTGKYDVIAEKESLVDVNVILAAGGSVHTELAHILPESTYFNVSGTRTSSPEKKDYAASVLAVLQRFGYDVEKVNGPKVHSLYNVMTMQKDVHDWFDRLEMWFESTGVENCYRVQTILRSYQVPGEPCTQLVPRLPIFQVQENTSTSLIVTQMTWIHHRALSALGHETES
ncbi:hypothetical protein APHAL10511_006772 [Amanita phalloides]|nr:hypothetical protein APHAL10511_006772 [Amanita phalloides]